MSHEIWPDLPSRRVRRTSQAIIEVGVAVDVGTREVTKRMAEWEDVDFVWQVSGEQDIVVVIDAADTCGVNELITQARGQEGVVSTKTRLILDEQLELRPSTTGSRQYHVACLSSYFSSFSDSFSGSSFFGSSSSGSTPSSSGRESSVRSISNGSSAGASSGSR